MKQSQKQIDSLKEFSLNKKDLSKVKGGFLFMPKFESVDDGVDIVYRDFWGNEVGRYCIQTPDLSGF